MIANEKLITVSSMPKITRWFMSNRILIPHLYKRMSSCGSPIIIIELHTYVEYLRPGFRFVVFFSVQKINALFLIFNDVQWKK